MSSSSSVTRRTSIAYRATRRLLGLSLLLLAVSAFPAYAQAATPTSRLAWDQIGQSVATASSATYTAFVDGSTTGIVVTGVVCVAGTPVTNATCTSNLPPLTPGTHTMTLTQTIGGASSPQSAPPLSFSYIVVVTPTNTRIVP